MPKQNINSVSHDNTRAELYWYGDPAEGTGHVHLTTVNTDLETSGDDPVPQHYKGFEVTLDEAGIDRLIKALHKAKHQAFGESMAAKADRAIKTWRKDLDEGADPAAARAKVWSSFGYSGEEIEQLEAALRSSVGTVPSYHSGGAVVPAEPVYATLAEDEHVLRDVTEVGQSERMWICARSEHAGRLCQERPYTWAEITAVPQPIRFDPPEVTVESDASAAARLDTDRYRDVRKGNR